jgi:hypothetical protein
MKRIKLTHGKSALVDDEDFEMLNQWKWCCGKGYAVRGIRDGKKMIGVSMHRVIIAAKKGEEVDHINRNRLDNRRKNLRIVTRSQNRRNGGGKGYHWSEVSQKWFAQIQINGKKKYLGLFTKESDARKAYLIEYNKCFL